MTSEVRRLGQVGLQSFSLCHISGVGQGGCKGAPCILNFFESSNFFTGDVAAFSLNWSIEIFLVPHLRCWIRWL